VKYSLYHGNSPYLSIRASHKALKKIQREKPELNINILEADNMDASEFVDKISSSGLFSSQRILFIKRLYRNKEKDVLTKYILEMIEKNQSEDIFIFWEDQKIRSTTKYLKAFKKNKTLNEYNKLNKRTFSTWLKQELKENELVINPKCQKILSENTNYDPERAVNEIEKLALTDEEITEEFLATTTSNTLELDIWKLIDYLNANDKANSLRVIENLTKQNNDPNYILAMLARNLRLITQTKHLVDQGKDSRQIASVLRLPPFTVPSLIKASHNQSYEKIKKMYEKFTNLDYQIKTGKINGNLGLTLLCTYI
jgi:DNA polymerase-3 subunit delta